jgi:broad specificity phosphatase PhoE
MSQGPQTISSSASTASSWVRTVAARRDDAPVAAVIRHAEREPIVAMHRSHDALLTAAGARDAREAGARLPDGRRLVLWHSPVRRCAQTAEQLAAGFVAARGSASVAGADVVLGAPYIRDLPATYELLDELGDPFVRAWFDGTVPPAVIEPLAVAARRLVDAVAARLRVAASGSLLVLVTHDWNVMLLREGILGLRFEEVGWPDYLEGPTLRLADGVVEVTWRDHRASCPPDG